ncbi:MAG: TonB family protein [Chitinophagales bacterium]|nr:TonB family protein [Hyphomicrobiales bacterium]
MASDHIEDEGVGALTGLRAPDGEFPAKTASLLQPVLALNPRMVGKEVLSSDSGLPARYTAPATELAHDGTRAKKAGIVISLAFHLGALVALATYVIFQGASDEYAKVISVELAPIEVLESVEEPESEQAAAASEASAAASASEAKEIEETPPSPESAQTEAAPTEETPAEEPESSVLAALPEQSQLAQPEAGEASSEKIDPDGVQQPADAPVQEARPAPDAPEKLQETRLKAPRPETAIDWKPETPKKNIKPARKKLAEARPARNRAKQQPNPQSAAARGLSGAQTNARQSASRGLAASYKDMVRARVAANRPSGGATRGNVTVSFRISSSGGVNSMLTSGTPELYSAAKGAVQKASPFPPPPTGTLQPFVITFTFQ